MNAKHPEARLSDITEGDEQCQLILRIQALAYRINNSHLADVLVDQTPTLLHVKVQQYFVNEALINETLSIGNHNTAEFNRARFLLRMREIIKKLQMILDGADRPEGAA